MGGQLSYNLIKNKQKTPLILNKWITGDLYFGYYDDDQNNEINIGYIHEIKIESIANITTNDPVINIHINGIAHHLQRSRMYRDDSGISLMREINYKLQSNQFPIECQSTLLYDINDILYRKFGYDNNLEQSNNISKNKNIIRLNAYLNINIYQIHFSNGANIHQPTKWKFRYDNLIGKEQEIRVNLKVLSLAIIDNDYVFTVTVNNQQFELSSNVAIDYNDVYYLVEQMYQELSKGNQIPFNTNVLYDLEYLFYHHFNYLRLL